MQRINKFLLITFIISTHSSIKCMEAEIESMQPWRTVSEYDAAPGWRTASEYKKEAKRHAKYIIHFTKDSSTNMSRNHKEIEELGTWLSEKRNNLSDEEWKKLIHKLNKRVSAETDKCSCPETKKRKALIEIIEEVALPLKSNENCSKKLVTSIEKEFKRIQNTPQEKQSSSEESLPEEQ